jgi:phage-related protein
MPIRQIQFYRTASDSCPIEEFLESLNAKQAQKIAWTLNAIRELPRVPSSYLKKLDGTNGIWEVRADFGGDAFRLLGFWDSGTLIVLTNGFAKKTDKTPAREIALAKQRMRDHLSRKK